jgi:hypothetical protein
MADKELDPVEWELVRADIAMEKARLKANGDWAKWEKFQAQTNARFVAHPAFAEGMARIASWWAVRTRDLSFLIAPPRRPRPRGWPLR